MFFFADPKEDDEEIVITNAINPLAIRDATEVIFYTDEEELGEITEDLVLHMIWSIYQYPKNLQWSITTWEEIVEKELKEARISLLEKTAKVRKRETEERTRKRIVRLLAIIENSKFLKYSSVLCELLKNIDGGYPSP